MKIASLWRISGDSLELRPDLERTEDAERKQQILDFLNGGGLVLRSPGRREDRLDPSLPPAVPLGYLSDGEWIWPMELAYYLEHHGILPEEEFLDHMRQRAFKAEQPTQEVLEAASRLLTEDDG